MSDASSSRCSAARRRLAARGARAAGESCRPLDFWGRARLSNWNPLDRGLRAAAALNSAGSRAAPSRSSIAGRRDATSATARSQPSSSASRSMSSSRSGPPSLQQSRRLRPSRSYSRLRSTRSARARRKPGATGRQRHRLVGTISRGCRQTGRDSARVAPGPAANGDHRQCRL